MKIRKTVQKPNGVRIVLYGTEGIGKTSTAARLPNPLFLDLEKSTYGMDVAGIDTMVPNEVSMSELLGIVEDLKKDHQGFETLVIDTADKLEEFLIRDMCRENKKDSIESWGYGSGYKLIQGRMSKVLDSLTDLTESGMNVCLVAHSALRKQELPEERGAFDRYELKLTKLSAPLLKEWSDLMIFIRYKTNVSIDEKKKTHASGGIRWTSCEHTAAWDGKNRSFIGFKDNISLDDAVSLLPKVIAKATGKVGGKPSEKAKPVVEPPKEEPKEESVEEIEFPPEEEGKEEKTFSRTNVKLMFDLMRQYNVLPDKLTKYLLDKKRFGNEIPPLEELPDDIVDWLNRGMDKIAKKLQ